MQHVEGLPYSPVEHKWRDLNWEKIQQLHPDDQIIRFPMNRLIASISERVPTDSIVGANAYGDLGGDLLQHGQLRAIHIMAESTTCVLSIKSLDAEKQRIFATAKLPDTPHQSAKDFWGREEVHVHIPFSRLEPPLSRVRRQLIERLSRLKR